MSVEDEIVSGCLPLFKSRSTPDVDLSSRRTTNGVVSMSQRSKFTEKVLRLFRPFHSDHEVSSKQTASSGDSCGGQPPRRKYMRVVTDRNAPPPDKPNDNPNIIPHYSQQYLRNYYDDKHAKDCDRVLPYIVSDNSILKKSLTDPTSDRRSHGCVLNATIGSSEKHATFCDKVTVFDCFQHTVTEEKLHGGEDSDVESDNCENASGDGIGSFFLESDSVPCALQSGELAEELSDIEDTLDSAVDATAVQQVHAKLETRAMHNIFATFTAPPDVMGSEKSEHESLPAMRQVDLKSIVEQSLATEERERTD